MLNIESQSYNPASHLRLFQSHHTYALRINIHAQMTVSTDKPSHTEVQTGTETPGLETLTIYFMQVFQKPISQAVRLHELLEEEEKEPKSLLDSSY